MMDEAAAGGQGCRRHGDACPAGQIIVGRSDGARRIAAAAIATPRSLLAAHREVEHDLARLALDVADVEQVAECCCN